MRPAARARVDRGALGLSIFYLGLALPLAARLSLFHDDIFVLAVARQGGWGAIWRALQQGADNLPPLDYWLHHLSIAAFGESKLAFRLPSILAIWGAVLFIYALVQRHLARSYALGAALLALVVVGFDATFLTRGHALLLLSFSAALFCWDRIKDDRWASPLFVLSLVVAVYSHYYGVLMLAVFFAAACAQQLVDRRFSVLPFALIAIAGALCAPLLPLARAASAHRGGFWTPVTLTAVLDFYPSLLTRAINCVVAIALVLAIAPTDRVDEGQKERFPFGVTLALVAAVCVLVPMFLLARVLTGAFHSEYAQSAAVALAILGVAQIAKLRVDRRWIGAGLVIVPALFVAFMGARTVQGFFTERLSRESVSRLTTFQAARSEPVVLTDDALFVVLSYEREGEPLENRYFVYDANPARRTNVDLAIAGLTPLMHLRALPYEEFRRVHSAFIVVGSSDSPLIARAVGDGARVTMAWDAPTRTNYWSVRFD